MKHTLIAAAFAAVLGTASMGAMAVDGTVSDLPTGYITTNGGTLTVNGSFVTSTCAIPATANGDFGGVQASDVTPLGGDHSQIVNINMVAADCASTLQNGIYLGFYSSKAVDNHVPIEQGTSGTALPTADLANLGISLSTVDGVSVPILSDPADFVSTSQDFLFFSGTTAPAKLTFKAHLINTSAANITTLTSAGTFTANINYLAYYL
jgi:hypothetical protein